MKSSTTSGTRKKYKPGQLITINNRVFRIVKDYRCMDDCIGCFDRNYEKYNFCFDLPLDLHLKPILKHKG